MSKVYHFEIFGLREDKYDWLDQHSIENVKWNKLEPKSEFYLFIPQDAKLQSEYMKFEKITDIFPVNSVGIVTARDALTIGWTEDEIWNRVRNFARLEKELARETYQLGKDARDWKVELAQNDLKESGLDKKNLTEILYRPFDLRYTYYTGKSRGFHCMPRDDVMQHLMKKNIALCVGRQSAVIGSDNYDIVFISENIVDLNLFRRGGELVFPLYIYAAKNSKSIGNYSQLMLFEPEVKYKSKKPNIIPELFAKLKENFKRKITPEEIFYYIYAVLYSATYRKKYAEFLKIDFPRVPFTKNYKLFIRLEKLGKQLADLHLLKSKELENTFSKFQGKGKNKVEKPKFEEGKVWINKEQYFDGIKEEVWEYQIGGYQVCAKWLKDRKGRTLTLDEIKTYCKITTALSKTIETQKEIDKYFDNIEKTAC